VLAVDRPNGAKCFCFECIICVVPTGQSDWLSRSLWKGASNFLWTITCSEAKCRAAAAPEVASMPMAVLGRFR